MGADRPKPPKPHETWIDALVDANAAFVPLIWQERARAELEELRAIKASWEARQWAQASGLVSGAPAPEPP